MKIILIILAVAFSVITALFIKFKSNDIGKTTRKEEKEILKKVKEKEKEDASIAKQHVETSSNTSEIKRETSLSHDKRKDNMKHLFSKRGLK